MVGRYCRLEPFVAQVHAPALFEANGLEPDARGWTYLPYGPFLQFDHYLRWCQAMERGPDPAYFAVIDLRSGRATGLAAYLRIEPDAGSIEVGHLKFSPLLQRTPAATEAMVLMMERAFSGGYRRYEWKCDSLNAPSRAAALRLGFAYEGLFRNATVVKGRSRDTAWYSIIDSEWPVLRPAFERWLAPSNFAEAGRQRERLSDLTHGMLARVLPARVLPASCRQS